MFFSEGPSELVSQGISVRFRVLDSVESSSVKISICVYHFQRAWESHSDWMGSWLRRLVCGLLMDKVLEQREVRCM